MQQLIWDKGSNKNTCPMIADMYEMYEIYIF